MTNEEKALEIARKYSQIYGSGLGFDSSIECYASAIQMAKWKDKQAIEYLYKNIQSLLKDYGISEASADIATQLFLANFKKAMEE